MAAVRWLPSWSAILLTSMVLVPAALVLLARTLASPSPGAPGARPAAETAPGAPATSALAAIEGRPALRGRILDPTGDPVPGATVHVVAADADAAGPRWTVVALATTDATGSFSLAHVEVTRVRVEAERDPIGAVRSAALDVPADRSTEVTLVLAPAGLHGSVVDAAGRPVAGASLSTEGAPWATGTVTSDEAGAFRMPVVPFEATTVVAVAPGYRTARVSLGAREDQPEPELRLQLQAAAPVDGDVLDPDGKPARARVVACEGQAGEARVQSGEDGTFRLPPSTIGCTVFALHDELGPSEAMTVLEGRRAVLRLQPGGTIEGDVVDGRGAAVAAFSVGVESFVGPHGASARGTAPRTFEGGTFRWGALTPGTYVLSAAAPGAPPARSAPIEVRGGAVARGVRIVLAHGGTVRGRVIDDRGAPLPGVTLAFDRVSTTVDSAATATTDETGAYVLDRAAPAGLFTLRADKPGYRTRFLSGLRVAPGASLVQDVVLSATDGGGPGFELGGIGAGLTARDNGIEIASVFPGDPAERAGLRPGDRILAIDGDDTAGLSLSDALQRLRGPSGTSVGVTAKHRGQDSPFEVIIVRAQIAH